VSSKFFFPLRPAFSTPQLTFEDILSVILSPPPVSPLCQSVSFFQGSPTAFPNFLSLRYSSGFEVYPVDSMDSALPAAQSPSPFGSRPFPQVAQRSVTSFSGRCPQCNRTHFPPHHFLKDTQSSFPALPISANAPHPSTVEAFRLSSVGLLSCLVRSCSFLPLSGHNHLLFSVFDLEYDFLFFLLRP